MSPQPPVVEWIVSPGLVAYEAALAFMRARGEAIANGQASEAVWLLEHPCLYTAGTSARREDLLQPDRFPVHEAGRGGQYTYHGPGQRIVYVMLDVKRRFGDVRRFVTGLETWTVAALADLGVEGSTRPDRVGVWVDHTRAGRVRTDKIAALGVRLRRWVSTHGISVNVDPDLTHFAGIVPCGISDAGVTSLADLGLPATMADLDRALRAAFEASIAATRDAPAAALAD
ncbi:MAG: lipoyl(octanoyl) transferase LipB [Hyphomicrobiaceae bacterium]|nr:lipoyl(octanoyl) transferase LipB [Hyphomicrobiaceae bacterium]